MFSKNVENLLKGQEKIKLLFKAHTFLFEIGGCHLTNFCHITLHLLYNMSRGGGYGSGVPQCSPPF